MEVAKLAAPPNLEVRFVSCNESAIKRWLSSELEKTVFSLTHELFMTKHHTVTLRNWPHARCTTSITNNKCTTYHDDTLGQQGLAPTQNTVIKMNWSHLIAFTLLYHSPDKHF